MMTFRSTIVPIFAVAAISLATGGVQSAGAADNFFEGKTLTLLVGGAPGGGYATYANLFARHLGKYIPGNPTVVAKSMPGAGGLKATKIIYNVSPKDGTEMAAVFMGAIMEPLIGDQGKDFDATKLTYLGSLNREISICLAWNTSGIDKFDDLFKKEMVVGASGWSSSIRQYPTVLNNVLGTKFKVISGYKGSNGAQLAMEKGETQGICGLQWSSFSASHPDWLRDKKVKILLQMGPDSHPELDKLGVPTVWKYVKTKEQERALRLIFAQLAFGRPYILPPGVPADRVAVLRKAFMEAAKDPDFLAEAKKAKISVDPLSGEDVQKLVSEVYAASAGDAERAKNALGTKKKK